MGDCILIKGPHRHNCGFSNEGKGFYTRCHFLNNDGKCQVLLIREKNIEKGLQMLKKLNIDMCKSEVDGFELSKENGQKMWDWFTTFTGDEGYGYCNDCPGRSYRD